MSSCCQGDPGDTVVPCKLLVIAVRSAVASRIRQKLLDFPEELLEEMGSVSPSAVSIMNLTWFHFHVIFLLDFLPASQSF